MIPLSERPEGVVWIDGVCVVPDRNGAERLVGHYSGRGTHRGTFAGIPATGAMVRFSEIDVVRFAPQGLDAPTLRGETLGSFFVTRHGRSTAVSP